MKVWRCPHCNRCNVGVCCPQKAVITITTGAPSNTDTERDK